MQAQPNAAEKAAFSFALRREKPPGVVHQRVPAGEKRSILDADLGGKWLLCAQPV